MADDKKPGFFKRIFGLGKAEPVSAPVPQPVDVPVEMPLLADAHAERIAAEIAEAKEQAALAAREIEAEAERQKAESDRAESERIELEARQLQAQRDEEQRLAAVAKEQAEHQKRAQQEAAQELERQQQEKQEQEKQEQEKQEQEKQEQEKQEQEKLKLAAAKALADEREAQEKSDLARAAQERLAQEKPDQEKLEQKKLEQEKLQQERFDAERAAQAIVPPTVAVPVPAAPAAKTSWWQKLKSGLSRTASGVSDGITGLFTKRKLDAATLEDLEDILIQADLGIDVSARIAAAVGKGRYDKEIAPEEVKAILAEEVTRVLAPVAVPLTIEPSQRPFVLLMVGVNGSGKTTTIGKLAAKFRSEGKSVMLAAGDTFRAAAIEQLKVWGERTGAQVVAREQGGDAAGLAFDALKLAREQSVDVLMIDTAGRLQNRVELMAELEKVVRVIKKVDDTAPHGVLLVLDATVGQNALSQVEIFGKTAGVTGLVMTKLDGTARGGILVAIAEKFRMPVHFIGVGEGVDDLEPFAAADFARAIAGLEQTP